MKKLLAIVLAIACVLSFSACDDDGSNSQSDSVTIFTTTTKQKTTATVKEENKQYDINGLSFEVPASWENVSESSSNGNSIFFKKDNNILSVMLIGNFKEYVSSMGEEDFIDSVEETYTSGIENIKQTDKHIVYIGNLSGYRYVVSHDNKISHHYVLLDEKGECIVIGYQNAVNASDYSEAEKIIKSMKFNSTDSNEDTDDTELAKAVITFTDSFLYGIVTKEELAELIKDYNDEAKAIQNSSIKNMIQTIYEAANDSSSNLEDIKSYRNILALVVGEDIIQ